MKTRVMLVLSLFCGACLAQAPVPASVRENQAAYPESESSAAWSEVASSYVRKALKDEKLNRDPALNARLDAVTAAVGAALNAVDPRFAASSWKALLIEDFGHGAAAFPGQIILVDASFVRSLQLGDDELALIIAHEVAHVAAGHSSAKLSFMAEVLGKEKVPTARTALREFFADDAYAAAFQPTARRQEREADSLGAAVFFAAGYDAQRALQLFDKLAKRENPADGRDSGTHDAAQVRKQNVSGVFAELQQFHGRRVSASR